MGSMRMNRFPDASRIGPEHVWMQNLEIGELVAGHFAVGEQRWAEKDSRPGSI
jgi:hypothetical protein